MRRERPRTRQAVADEEREGVSLLLASRVRDGHQVLGEPIAPRALRAKRALAPENEGTNFALGTIVGRFDLGPLEESPKRCLVLQDIRTRT